MAPDKLLNLNGGSLEDSLHTELESILREQRNRSVSDRERDLNIYRSGSAPPTIEGSLNAVSSLSGRNDFREIGVNRGFSNNGVQLQSEEEIRANPSYLSYYHSNLKVNPRLPPPIMSKEDWRAARRFQGGGSSSSSDWRNQDAESSSLFSMQPSLSLQNSDSNLMDLGNGSGRSLSNQTSSPWLDRGTNSFAGSSTSGLGARRKSFADILQEGIDRPASLSNFLARPSSCNDFGDEVDSLEELRNGAQGYRSPVPYPVASAADFSLPRSRTPESKLIARQPSPGLPPVGSRVSHIDPKTVSGLDIQSFRSSDIAANLSNLTLSEVKNRDVNNYGNLDIDNNRGYNQNFQQEFIESGYTDLARKNGTVNNVSGASKLSPGMHMNFPKRTSSSSNLYSQVGSSGYGGLEGAYSYNRSANNPDIDFVPGAFPANQTRNSALDTHLDGAMTSIQNGQNMNSRGNKSLNSPLSNPRYVQQLLQQTPDYNSNILSDLSLVENRFGASHGDLNGIQKAYLETFLLNQQREQLELSLLGKSSGLNYDGYGIGAHGLGPLYQGNTIGTGSGTLMYQNDRVSRFNSMMRNSPGRSPGSLNPDISNNLEGRIVSSLLDEFKNNKIRSFELSDIVGHVVEFSTDQYGSRFIQQKLETATAEEKTTIFPEIVPHALTLMTDVFGNYVIQKFFEHGMDSQRKELANQLMGHVLPLSLQMYGCRVIQKALEVAEMDQQTQMVKELDGSVMKCVRDQNGNHVIQKCIECVPQEHIQFIVSAFYGQVIVLSSHPYGCRVIQRVLEHSDDSYTRQVIMEEIMQSVCTLAQDQYGNYVIQHVLQHGEPQERSAIIYKLAGQIVRMSQQKFASNVVEKCLTFGSPEERQILVTEMLGSTEENEPLQAMMKDPFGNYVVQKVLETCNDESLELLLSRIKVHLNTLKRYTYGKHIVSRIEKLIATGERRISLSSTIPSS